MSHTRKHEYVQSALRLFDPERLRGDDAKLYVVRRGGLLAIPNEELPSIFEFGFDKRGDRVSMRVGLPRSKQTIDELGGTIEIESTVGAGTSVVVRLPAAPS